MITLIRRAPIQTIYDQALAGAAASITVPAINQSGAILEVDVLAARSSHTAADIDNVFITLSGDTAGANYEGTLAYSGGGGTAGDNTTNGPRIIGTIPTSHASSNAAWRGIIRAQFFNYSAAAGFKDYLSESWQKQNSDAFRRNYGGHWLSANPITSVLLSLGTGANFLAGTRVIARIKR